MSTFTPRPPYTKEELEKLYPANLQLQQVQVLLRHGERTPVSSRFQNAGLAPNWPYCEAARRLSSPILTLPDSSSWDTLQWKRTLETFSSNDAPALVTGPKGEVEAICKPGELTDRGRSTTLALGHRLRHLYVDQLGFMPNTLQNTDGIYLRATPIPRALESLQQAFSGLYPADKRSPNFPPPTIVQRSPADETLYPNEGGCKRFAQLAKAFAERAAQRWNDTDDMKYLNKVLGKWMPASSPKVAVDSHPRLSGIMDTINATKAHGPDTKLPKEFYDEKALSNIDKIVVEEWFAGYEESKEYRMLGIGALMGDIVGRMVESTKGGASSVRLALSGCHDTTLAGALCSLGAFKGEKWPPFTSHIAFELFRNSGAGVTGATAASQQGGKLTVTQSTGWWQSLFGSPTNTLFGQQPDTTRKPAGELNAREKQQLDGYYVRIRFNDRIMQVPACQLAGNHFEGDKSLCTLVSLPG